MLSDRLVTRVVELGHGDQVVVGLVLVVHVVESGFVVGHIWRWVAIRFSHVVRVAAGHQGADSRQRVTRRGSMAAPTQHGGARAVDAPDSLPETLPARPALPRPAPEEAGGSPDALPARPAPEEAGGLPGASPARPAPAEVSTSSDAVQNEGEPCLAIVPYEQPPSGQFLSIIDEDWLKLSSHQRVYTQPPTRTQTAALLDESRGWDKHQRVTKIMTLGQTKPLLWASFLLACLLYTSPSPRD